MMYTAKELRDLAKSSLGGRVFGKTWAMLVLTLFIYQLMSNFIGMIPFAGTIAVLIIAGALMTGLMGMLLKVTRGDSEVNIGDLFSHFDGRSMGLCLLQFLYIYLWTLLFIIPGIIKSYSYAMAYFVHLDHPELTANQCITESRRLMDGYKWQLFCLDFSFIGWAILGALACGIGAYWVEIWMYTARAEFYNARIKMEKPVAEIE